MQVSLFNLEQKLHNHSNFAIHHAEISRTHDKKITVNNTKYAVEKKLYNQYIGKLINNRNLPRTEHKTIWTK